MTQPDPNDDLEKSQRKLERLNQLYAMLSRINRAIVRIESPHELYETACRIAIEDGGFGFAWIGLVEPDGQRIIQVGHAGASLDMNQAPITAASQGPSALAIHEGQPCIINDSANDPRTATCRKQLAQYAMRAVASFPIHMEDRVIGVFTVMAGEPGFFRDAEVCLLTEVADDISFSLEVMHEEEMRHATESKMQFLAQYDPQTGLPGREQFEERLAKACEHAGDGMVAALVVRLRHYRDILQVAGPMAGVDIARAIAVRLETALPTATVARITDIEFAVMLEQPEGLHLVEEMAWRIHGLTAEAVRVDEREIFMDPFVGIAVSPQDGAPSNVINAAQVAAAMAPADASSGCRFFVADMDRASRRRLDLDSALRRALERDEFLLHYQPQVNLSTGRVVGAEALLRWQRQGNGNGFTLVPPQDFIPILESTGLIGAVGEWVMHEACRCNQQWQDEGLPSLRMAVNLSACQFHDGDIRPMVQRALAASRLDPQWLELELTEGVVLTSADAVIRTMRDLNADGVTHALDDFGTGYSSLSYLQRLPVTRIKIDRAFVTNITSNPSDAAIARAMMGMAHSLGLTVIAEGVETEGQLGYLRSLGCEEMQGYYFSKPLPPDQFATLLREGRGIAPAESSGKSERVLLLVDDEPNILSALQRVLRPFGFRILATTSALEGLNLLAVHRVGVVLCDQRMPLMTGTEFLRRVKVLYPDVVRLILSGYTELNSVIDAVNRGAVYKFLTKPWEEDVLVENLQEAFRHYELKEENRELSRRLEELLPTGHIEPKVAR